jgi:ABC-2 type transport system ATP-binding protein
VTFVIEATALTKRYGETVAVDGLSFRVCPGRVTGFLGPNGAGKSTTMRMILGLDRPTGGAVTVDGVAYRTLPVPLRRVGSMLDATTVHGGRTAYHHLLWLAQSNGIGRARIHHVLELTGLDGVAGKRVKGFSLGMAQRLGIAAALLGDPGVLILDEPVNGLDTEGIRWIRDLLKGLAADGRTVFLSSHLMSEMELTADHLIVIGRGRLLADAPMREFIERNSRPVTLVRSPQSDRLAAALDTAGARTEPEGPDGWLVTELEAAAIGDLAAAQHIVLHELTPRMSSLEDVYTRITHSTVDYRAQSAGAGTRK